MDTNTQDTTTAQVLAAAANFTYHFKSITPAQLEALLAKYEVADQDRIRAEFEAVKDGKDRDAFKRKSVPVTLTYPTLPEGTPALVQDWTNGYIAQFVKSQYIDDFAEVGPHDLETIAAVIAASGGRSARFDFTEEQLSAAAKSYGDFVAARVGNAAISDKLAKAAEAKFTIAAIKKWVGQFDETTVQKLKGHLEAWAGWLVETSEELAEEYGSVYAALDARLAKHLADGAQASIAEYL